MASFMQELAQQAALAKVAENTGEKNMVLSITDDLSTGTLKSATEALLEIMSPFEDIIAEIAKQPQSPERDARLQRKAKLQAVVEDAWSNRIVKLGKR